MNKSLIGEVKQHMAGEGKEHLNGVVNEPLNGEVKEEEGVKILHKGELSPT